MAIIKCSKCGQEISDRAEKCIHCGEVIAKGQPIKICPECEKEVPFESTVCPHCGCPIEDVGKTLEQVDNNRYSNSISVKKSKKTRIRTTIAIISAIIVLLLIGYVNRVIELNRQYAMMKLKNSYIAPTVSTYPPAKMDYVEQRNKDLKITVTSVTTNSSSTVCEGTLKNNGTKRYEFIKLKGSFTNSTGDVVDTAWTYAVGSEGLAQGESTKFKMFVDKNYSIKGCTVTFITD